VRQSFQHLCFAAAKKARKDLEDAESSARNVENEIRDIEAALNKDYGPEEEFATLEGACFDFTDNEYTYTFCPFDEVIGRAFVWTNVSQSRL